MSNVIGGLKVAESTGAHLRLSGESATVLNTAHRPWRWPLALSTPELVCLMGWPLGEGTLPGVAGAHPKVLAPPSDMHDSERPFAVSSAP